MLNALPEAIIPIDLAFGPAGLWSLSGWVEIKPSHAVYTILCLVCKQPLCLVVYSRFRVTIQINPPALQYSEQSQLSCN